MPSDCRMCDLCITRKKVVRGTGKADVMLIGEAPGYHEDKSGTPFIGESGKYLRSVMSKYGVDIESLFITNIVKCRPPNNRNPYPEEIKTCMKYFLAKEIPHVNPIFIIPVGKIATDVILCNQVVMKNTIGRVFKSGNRWIIPIYHPSYILQNSNLKELYEKLIPYVFNKIGDIKHDYALDIAANFDKGNYCPF